MPSPFPGAIAPPSPFRSPVPLPTLGTGDVTVTFDQGWLPYIIGACKALVAASTWDPPTQADVTQTIFAAYDLLKTLSGATAPVPPVPFGCGGDCDMCSQLRYNNCVLQQFDCITQIWVDVPTVGSCVPNTAPGGGTTPPVAGKCQDYNFQFVANALTPLPFVVNSGDVITINTLNGAGTDGTISWYCVNGQAFVLGTCSGGEHTVSTDPLPTSPHMSVVLKIGSTYYPFVSGAFTVPGGVTNLQPYIGVNDSPISDDAGTYAIDLNFCNNQTPPTANWCQSLDFTISPQGVVSFAVTDGCGDSINNGAWVSGQGWQTPAYTPSCISSHTQAQGTLALDLGISATITSVELDGHYFGNASSSRQIYVELNSTPPWSGGGPFPINDTSFPAASDYALTSGSISVAARYIQIGSTDLNPGTGINPVFVHKKLILKGTGANPFSSSNC